MCKKNQPEIERTKIWEDVVRFPPVGVIHLARVVQVVTHADGKDVIEVKSEYANGDDAMGNPIWETPSDKYHVAILSSAVLCLHDACADKSFPHPPKYRSNDDS